MKINNKIPSGAFVNPDGVFILRTKTLVLANPNEGVRGEAVKEIKVYAGERYKGDSYNEYQEHELFFLKELFRSLYCRIGIKCHCHVVGK